MSSLRKDYCLLAVLLSAAQPWRVRKGKRHLPTARGSAADTGGFPWLVPFMSFS